MKMGAMSMCVAAAAVPLLPIVTHAHVSITPRQSLEKHQDSTIAVNKNRGKTVSIKIDKQTAISQNNKKIDASALRVGQSLVVDACGDTEEGSLALEIRSVPPIRRGTE
jgi:hypothetical protein